MDALILYGSTGGGHGGASIALKEEMERRGHHAEIMDPFDLVNERMGGNIGGMYVSTVRHASWLFSLLYSAGELYRRLPIRSPVYVWTKRAAEPLGRYLTEHHYDAIIAVHLFPAMILTALKEDGFPLPPTLYIGTDYTCIPFTEETHCDYTVIPSPRLLDDYISKGVDPETLLPFGIPVREEFRREANRETLLTEMEYDPAKRYLLMVGGSMGAGKIYTTVKKLRKYLRRHPDHMLIVVCGTNERLYKRLSRRYSASDQILLKQVTTHLGSYMRVSDVLISKPGGLSCTEAAVSQIPLIHVAPIRGCETRNMKFFAALGLSVNLATHRGKLTRVLEQFDLHPSYGGQMMRLQAEEINPHAAEAVCDFVEGLL